MCQDIAVARGSTYDTLNARMDRCQANIETISDDIQLLQGNLEAVLKISKGGVGDWGIQILRGWLLTD